MNLAQALKQKNRLAGEIARQQAIMQRENARRNDSVSKVRCDQVLERILALSAELGVLKAKIAAANIGIYSAIERMAEAKSLIAFYQGLPKREGEEVDYVGRNDEKIVHTWTSFVNQADCDAKVAELQKQINDLQDKVDTYNATTEI